MQPHTSVPASSYGQTYRGPITTAIFDWAGTVLDFGCIAPVHAFRECFLIAGVPISEAEARGPMGAAKREHIEIILGTPDVLSRWEEQYGTAPGKADVDALYADFLSIDKRNVAHYSDLIPGALDSLSVLRARGIRIGSTTGYPREVMNNLLPIARDKGYSPDHCCTVSDVRRGRPFPDMCLDNALVLGAPDVRACVVIDDSPTGLESGIAAGMWTVGIAASGNEVGLSLADWQALGETDRHERISLAGQRLAQSGAHYVIDTIADLPPVIDAIELRLGAGEKA